jgi:hypothetical protein
MNRISFADAEVALRSLPRRFSEVISGPPDDPAWDRIVRAPSGTPARSALGWAATAASMATNLADLTDDLLRSSAPQLDLRDEAAASFQPDDTTSVASMLDSLRIASTRAADALAARRSEDSERTVHIDGEQTAFGDAVSRLVSEATGAIRRAQQAIDAAT